MLNWLYLTFVPPSPTTLNIEQFCSSISGTIAPSEVQENTFTPLITPISAAELSAAISEQNVQGSPGADKVPASLIKKIAPRYVAAASNKFQLYSEWRG